MFIYRFYLKKYNFFKFFFFKKKEIEDECSMCLLGGYFYGNNKYEGFNKKICEWQ